MRDNFRSAIAEAPFSDRSLHLSVWADWCEEHSDGAESDRLRILAAMKFAWIPPGSFLMGSPDNEEGRYSDESPQHKVTLIEGFYLGTTTVTQAQWQAVMGNNPSHFKGANRPVENVSWDDCQEFCQKLKEIDGKLYRLPTEAEWEYACRAGTTAPFSSGSDEAALKKVGWYGGNSNGETHPVGQLAANIWGLYDMHGNVWEWCQDWYNPYVEGQDTDPFGPNEHQPGCSGAAAGTAAAGAAGRRTATGATRTTGTATAVSGWPPQDDDPDDPDDHEVPELDDQPSARVLRGGSWRSSGRGCRSAVRRWDDPDDRRHGCGFRLAAVS